MVSRNRKLPWDWYDAEIPASVAIDENAYVETSFSFYHYRSQVPDGVKIGRGASTFLGTMFDVGRRGRVNVGDYSLLHGAWIICDTEVIIGDYALISWNVVIMDTRRVPTDPNARRRALVEGTHQNQRRIDADPAPKPVRLGHNVWVGFESCVLPGVTIGDGAIVGARSVVVDDVPAYSVVAGNPARFVRSLYTEAMHHGV